MSILTKFIAATFAICWGMAAVFALFVGDLNDSQLGFFALASVYMLTPGAVAIVLDWRSDKRVRDNLALKFSPNWWWLVAWLLPALISIAALAASGLVPEVSVYTDTAEFLGRFSDELSGEQMASVVDTLEGMPIWALVGLLVVQGLVTGATINAFFGLGEELGWRGLMLRELAEKGLWRSSAIIGAVWGIWHGPLILMGHNYPEHPEIGVGVMVVFCVLLSPWHSWVAVAGRSTIAPAVMHGTLNATAGLSVLFVDDPIELVTGIHGLVGFGVLVVANLVLYAFVRPEFDSDEWPRSIE